MLVIQEALEGRKRTIVVSEKGESEADLRSAAKRHFHCSNDQLVVKVGWMNKGKLREKNPKTAGTRKVYFAFYRREKN